MATFSRWRAGVSASVNNAAAGDRQVRYSLIWEYTPMQFPQRRLGLRSYDGIPTVDAQNRDVFFAELHGYF